MIVRIRATALLMCCGLLRVMEPFSLMMPAPTKTSSACRVEVRVAIRFLLLSAATIALQPLLYRPTMREPEDDWDCDR